MGGETFPNPQRPSSRADMESWTLNLIMLEAKDHKGDDVDLDVSLSGDKSKGKQLTPVHKDGSMDAWSGPTFSFPVNKAAPPSGSLKFKIKKAKLIYLAKRVGDFELPIKDLLDSATSGDMKPKVLEYKVNLSEKKQGVLRFYCELVPPPPKEGEPVTVSPAATVPPASYPAAAAPTLGETVPPPSEPVTVSSVATAPPASYPAVADLPQTGVVSPSAELVTISTAAPPALSSAAKDPPPTGTVLPPTEPVMVSPAATAPPASYPAAMDPPPTVAGSASGSTAPVSPAATAPPASNPAAVDRPPTGAALPSSGTLLAGYMPGGYPPSGMTNAPSNYGHPPLAGYPPRAASAGGVYPPLGMPNAPSNYGYSPYPVPQQGYPTWAIMHPSAGYWRPVVQPYASENIGARVGSGVAVEMITGWINSFNNGSDDGTFSDAWF